MIETHTEILRHSCDGPPCRIDGGWTSWSDWTEWTEDGSCDSQTGMAWYSRNRTRSCSNPLPSGGGQSCSGESLESEREQRSCKIDGGWTDWTEWEDDGSCQANGKRRQKKTRQCTQPLPRNGGAPCEGANVEYRYVDCCYGGTRTMSAWCSDSDSAGLGCQLQVSCNSGCRATDPRTRRYGSLGEGGSYSNIVTNGDTATATWRNDGSLCSNCTQTGRLDVTCRE